MKNKLLLGVMLLCISFGSFVIYNHQNSPDVDDIFRITKTWSPTIEEVYVVKKIDDEWLTFFRNKNMFFVRKLKQNWVGSWNFVDGMGQNGPAGGTYYPQENEGVTWGASGFREQTLGGQQISYYFGMISDPNIEKVIIEAQGKEYKDISFIDSNGHRFFLIQTEGKVAPYSFKALSKDGEIIYPRPPRN